MQLKSALLACTLGCIFATPGHAGIIVHAGSTTGAPTYDRINADLSPLSDANGTNVNYNRYNFTVDAGGVYSFMTAGSYDTYSFLYSPSFSPANAATNAVVGNDDLFTLGNSGFTANLLPGISYALITTAFSSGESGFFTATIGGAGNIIPAVADTAVTPSANVFAYTGDTTAAGYDAHTFRVASSGTYTFLTTGTFDTFIDLYSSFDPLNPGANILKDNDDYFGVGNSAFAVTLLAGVDYTFVTSGYSSTDRGLFSNAITGPGAILVTPAAVPEPEVIGLMLIGLAGAGAMRRRKGMTA